MIIDGHTLNYFGLMLLDIKGPLDMPSRLGAAFYDWGDTIEPLVHSNDLHWKARQITCEFYFDGVKHSLTKSQLITRLNDMTHHTLIETSYGNYNVNLKEVKELKSYSNTTGKFLVTFYEQVPGFLNIPIATADGLGDYRIDGYGLSSFFGLIVSKVSGLDSIKTKQLSNTNYYTSNSISTHNDIRIVQIQCSKVFTTRTELKTKIEKLNKILSNSGLRTVHVKGSDYTAFLKDGFKVSIKGKVAKFTIKLNII